MKERVCPWWLGYLLASPIRKLAQDPEKILGVYLKEGMTVLDVGSAMGFFSLPMARLVGEKGQVICVDLQERMLRTLRRRATKAGLSGRMQFRLCKGDSLMVEDLAGKIDFALAFAMVHEVPDKKNLFSEIYRTLRGGAFLLLSEPKGHVTREEFDSTLQIALSVGFQVSESPIIGKSHSRLLLKSSY